MNSKQKYQHYKKKYLEAQAQLQRGGRPCHELITKDNCVENKTCDWKPEMEDSGMFSKGTPKLDTYGNQIGTCQRKSCGSFHTKTGCQSLKKQDDPNKDQCVWRPVLRGKMVQGGLSVGGVPLHSDYTEVEGHGTCDTRRELCIIL